MSGAASSNVNDDHVTTRDLVSVVLVEAVGSSFTPFVPVPFVDDYLFARLLRRITRKVIEQRGTAAEDDVTKRLVNGYTSAGDSGLGEKALTAAARFVARKVAIVLDVKKSHDVFGESIAFALALDVGVRHRMVHFRSSHAMGGAIFRSTQSVGSAALEVLTRAGRAAFKEEGASAKEAGAPSSSRFSRVSDAIAHQLDDTRRHLDHLMTYEISQLSPDMR